MSAPSPETRFVDFNRHTVIYKTVNGHAIDVQVLIPKHVQSGSHPLFVQFHGGCLITGTALHPDWFPPYVTSFILAHSAILIAPNHRLLPESRGADILTDLSDFWAWLQSSLPAYLTSILPALHADFTHLLVSGDSAGGWMALQSAYMLPKDFIKAMFLTYPITQALPGAGATEKYGLPIPDAEWLERYLSNIKPGAVVTSAAPPARMDVCFALIEHGRMSEFLGAGAEFDTLEALDGATWFPRTWVLHGKDDTLVSLEYSVRLAEKVEGMFPGRLRLTVRPGEHAFDHGLCLSEEEKWLGEGLDWVAKAWL
ncbi:alpha/beta-hydrolase [Lophium mytilinum]|uniref:Alpha/beta-hydrolase n=1 Tax=Lophium mytilinum TaxID=390894 RepID=A0A6A6QA59_9PEZI|nr:alpha/beta-hydrolase [Lophium mytilinum]